MQHKIIPFQLHLFLSTYSLPTGSSFSIPWYLKVKCVYASNETGNAHVVIFKVNSGHIEKQGEKVKEKDTMNFEKEIPFLNS